MKTWIHFVVCSALCSLSIAQGRTTKRHSESVWGIPTIYSNIFLEPETGDLGGMEVIIIPSEGADWACVVIASAIVYNPILVPLKRNGLRMEFTIPDTCDPPSGRGVIRETPDHHPGGTFKGTITRSGLLLNDGVNEPRLLKKQCRQGSDAD